MSRIEELLHNASEHGQRTAVLNEASKIKAHYPNWSLVQVYEEAYQNIMNT